MEILFCALLILSQGSVIESVCKQRQLKVNNTDYIRPTGLTVDNILNSRVNTELKTSAYCASVDVEGFRAWISTLSLGQSAYAHVRILWRSGSHVRVHVDDVLWPGSFQGEKTSIPGSFPNDVACGLSHKSALLRILEQQDA